ncbi:beta-propeller domain-containing protein [Dactylosporangium darangshiense]|uniref:Beta-propeller domain-containing protein n=1 Tax=Dactylosporangium darangshiense TaxID=579108 RepID=A0ABP8CUS4_9ACTN
MKRAAVTLGAVLLLLAGCTASRGPSSSTAASADAPAPAPALRLVAYDSCADLVAGLRKATQEAVTPWGLAGMPGDMRALNAAGDARAASAPEAMPGAAKAQAGADQAYSGTNTHEANVDEPDMVKTDGKRIVTLTGAGVLTVVDAAARKVTGTLRIGSDGNGGKRAASASQLLLSGDRALVLGYDYTDPEHSGAEFTLVDLAGPPKVVGTFNIGGSLVDARQVGSVARIVVRSSPRIDFPAQNFSDQSKIADDDARLAANRATVAGAPVESWLPQWAAVDATGKRTEGRVDCGAVSLPDSYSGTSMLTITTFDLAAPALGLGDPVTIAADGGIVYANGPSLYVANDQRWRTYMPMAKRGVAADAVVAVPQRTQLFKFTVAGAARPRYVAAGEVPGWLLNQYSMSEWDGRLRVATTANDASTVYVLEQRGGALAESGHVGGLGKGERIYSVRFVGTAGYVVTFRQTDPLYTLDLSDPAAPRAVGELKITGYSAYLHPAGDGRLIGVGQEANEKGRVQGLQVSLFDVHNMAAPARLAQFQVPGATSAAEFDPHAFLYWPATGLLVLPQTSRNQPDSAASALVLSVSDKAIAKTGVITHPTARYVMIERSLVIGGTLWTLSQTGLQANDMATLAQQAWLSLPSA